MPFHSKTDYDGVMSFDGLVVASFESRHAEQMAELIRRHGGKPLVAPSMREIPIADQHEAFAFGEELLGGRCDILVLLTGVGTRLLVDTLASRWPRKDVVAALEKTLRVCRGPKPVRALRELGLAPTLTVPEPNTWRDLLQALDAQLGVEKKRVFVQEYGRRNEELLEGLHARGAIVTAVPVYGYGLPLDTGPLRAAIDAIVAEQVDVVLFTSARQADHLFEVAAERAHALRERLARSVLVVSVGPIATESLRDWGIVPDLAPEHPKMGHLVKAAAEEGPALLARKRSR